MEQCDHVCLMHDDRWGAFRTPCELGLGHEGPHQHTMNACTPIALLIWEA